MSALRDIDDLRREAIAICDRLIAGYANAYPASPAASVTPIESCATCGLMGVRNIGIKSYCGAHASAIYRTFRPDVWGLDGGIGLLVGMRDDGLADLECSSCIATWAGALFERCAYCARHLANAVRWQADDLLRPPSDATEAALNAWAQRLAAGVEHGSITRKQATAAWSREVRDVA